MAGAVRSSIRASTCCTRGVVTRRSRIAGCLWLFSLCVFAAGCTRGEETGPASGLAASASAPSAGSRGLADQGVRIEFRSTPDPPTSGDNTFEATVKNPDGSPVTDATVTAVFSMPAMPAMNMPAMRGTATLVPEGGGRYRGIGQLSMGGTWNLTVAVSRGSEELARRSFSVVAK